MKFGYFFVIVIVFICGIVNAHDQESVGAPLLHHPLGYSEIVWDDSDQFSRVFFVQYDMKGGDKFASQTNGAMLDMRHGKQCIVSGEMLFDIDDTFLYDIDEDIQLELTFDVSHSTGFVVSDSGLTIPGMYGVAPKTVCIVCHRKESCLAKFVHQSPFPILPLVV